MSSLKKCLFNPMSVFTLFIVVNSHPRIFFPLIFREHEKEEGKREGRERERERGEERERRGFVAFHTHPDWDRDRSNLQWNL